MRYVALIIISFFVCVCMSNTSEIYSGIDSYKQIERLFKKSKNISIISPYISQSYAQILLRYSANKNIRLITSNAQTNAQALKFLLAPKLGVMKTGIFVLLLTIISFLINFILIGILLGIFSVMFIFLGYMRLKTKNVGVKIPKGKFIHEKVYIGDDYAITTSANLTYSGMHKNIENMVIIRDNIQLEQLSRHFNDLWYAG